MMRWIGVLLFPWGRIGRLAFWLLMVVAAMFVVLPFLGLVFFIMMEAKQPHLDDAENLVVGLLAIIVMCAAVYVSTVACAKRFNDRGKSSWWLFVGFFPVLGQLWLFIELGCLKGTSRHNRYGPSPFGQSADIGAIFDDQPFAIVAQKGRASNLLAVLAGWIASVIALGFSMFLLFRPPP